MLCSTFSAPAIKYFKFLKLDFSICGIYFFKNVSVEKNTVDLVFSISLGIVWKCKGVGYKNTLQPYKTGSRTPIPKPKE